jgi:hypothetical protein
MHTNIIFYVHEINTCTQKCVLLCMKTKRAQKKALICARKIKCAQKKSIFVHEKK